MSLTARRRIRTLYINALVAQQCFRFFPRDGLFSCFSQAANLLRVSPIFKQGQKFLPHCVIKEDGFFVAAIVHNKFYRLQ